MNTFTQDELWEAIQTLGWDVRTDDITLEIAGTQVYEIEGDGTRWKPVKGTRKYNKDASHCYQESIISQSICSFANNRTTNSKRRG